MRSILILLLCLGVFDPAVAQRLSSKKSKKVVRQKKSKAVVKRHLSLNHIAIKPRLSLFQTLNGTVICEDNNSAYISGASVSLLPIGLTTKTDTCGRFSLTYLPMPGVSYSVYITATGMKYYEKPLVSGSTCLDFSMQRHIGLLPEQIWCPYVCFRNVLYLIPPVYYNKPGWGLDFFKTTIFPDR